MAGAARARCERDRVVRLIFVPGNPLPKGSKAAQVYRAKSGKYRARLVEVADMKRQSRKAGALVAWMDSIGWLAKAEAAGVVLQGPVALSCTFYLEKPEKPKHDSEPITKPDVDKLARAVMDALTEIAYVDDHQVVELVCRKRFATPLKPVGVEIEWQSLDRQESLF